MNQELITPKGYAHNYIRVNLSKKKIEKQQLPSDLPKLYLGGTGFCARILWDEVTSQTDPLGPENKLIFMTGPLTGTASPSTGRYSVCAKSPLTGFCGQANSAGFWGRDLKRSGFDGVGEFCDFIESPPVVGHDPCL